MSSSFSAKTKNTKNANLHHDNTDVVKLDRIEWDWARELHTICPSHQLTAQQSALPPRVKNLSSNSRPWIVYRMYSPSVSCITLIPGRGITLHVLTQSLQTIKLSPVPAQQRVLLPVADIQGLEHLALEYNVSHSHISHSNIVKLHLAHRQRSSDRLMQAHNDLQPIQLTRTDFLCAISSHQVEVSHLLSKDPWWIILRLAVVWQPHERKYGPVMLTWWVHKQTY